jgi:hypothetical protein
MRTCRPRHQLECSSRGRGASKIETATAYVAQASGAKRRTGRELTGSHADKRCEIGIARASIFHRSKKDVRSWGGPRSKHSKSRKLAMAVRLCTSRRSTHAHKGGEGGGCTHTRFLYLTQIPNTTILFGTRKKIPNVTTTATATIPTHPHTQDTPPQPTFVRHATACNKNLTVLPGGGMTL